MHKSWTGNRLVANTLRLLVATVLSVFCSSIFVSCWRTTSKGSDSAGKQSPNGRISAWRRVGPGGGGATFAATVSPHNPAYAFVSCNMTGSYITKNGGEFWRMFSLRQPVSYYVFDPMDSNVVYANSNVLFRSTDAGQTWSVVYPNPADVIGAGAGR